MPNVTKTLIVGLGSTGTEICDCLYKRLRWQYGGIENVPWVKFLCIETNTGTETALRDHFLTITIGADALKDYKDNAARHNERMQLSQWLDSQALEDFKADSVVGGAGNIRAVGRLAFFHNYSTIKDAIAARVEGLRNLSLTGAADARWRDINFAFEGALRVFVVGGLTGGTCGGSVCDVGFLLKRLLNRTGERAIAMLGFPNPGLSSNDAPRWKKNAWHTLMELDTYCQPDSDWPSFRYPGEPNEVTRHEAPFDAVFLFQPESTDPKNGVQILNGQIAEALYLNIFAPGVDIWAHGVDMTRHRLCSLGIAVIEFPAERVVEACSKRLLSRALEEWLSSAAGDEVHESLGVNWNWLLGQCFTTEAGDDLLTEVKRDIRTVSEFLSKMRIRDAEETISKIASSFQSQSGRVRTNVNARIQALPRILETKLESGVSRHLRDLKRGGPHNFIHALKKVSRFLVELEKRQTPEEGQDIEGLISKLRRISRSSLLMFMGLRTQAARHLVGNISACVRREYGESATERVILGCIQAHGDGDVIRECEGIVVKYVRRMEGLESRARNVQKNLDNEWTVLAKESPVVCGFSLFERADQPEQDGTVNAEYRSCLAEADSSQARNWIQGESRAMTDVIGALGPVENYLIGRGSTLLDSPQNPNQKALPVEIIEPMLEKAATYFSRVHQEDVLRRWANTDNSGPMARDLATLSEPSVRVEPSRASRGHRQLYRHLRYLLLPADGSDNFRRELTDDQLRGVDQSVASPNRHTIAWLQQHVALDLNAILSAIGSNGLHTAQCGEFKVWHTRKNVAWLNYEVELSPDVEALRAKIVVGVLLRILKIKDQTLQLPVPDLELGSRTLKLPWNTQEAARRVRAGAQDIVGQPLDRFEERLNELLQAQKEQEDQLLQAQKEQKDARSADDFYSKVVDAYRKKVGHQIPDRNAFGRLIFSYFRSDPQLVEAMKRQNRPTDEVKKRLWREAGARLPETGQQAEMSGFYCDCEELIGETETEAEAKLWMCPVCSKYYGTA